MANETTAKSDGHAQGGAHAHGAGRYFVVWVLLIIGTIVTAWTGRMDLGGANLPLALAIACVTALVLVS